MSVWKTIADTLRGEIRAGHYPTGTRLPTEAQLARRFGVNRHTVRRAAAALRNEGLIHSRRGAGMFVSARSTEYPLGRRVRFHRNLLAAGQTPSRRLLLLETRCSNATEAEVLQLPPGAQVHAVEGLSLADDEPIALFRSIFPADRLPTLPGHLRRTHSVTRALADAGVSDYFRASTRLTAKRASPTQASHLQISPGDPILRSVSINVDAEGKPVEYGRTWFAGDRVSLVVGDE